MKGFARGLALKKKVLAIRKWPIQLFHLLESSFGLFEIL